MTTHGIAAHSIQEPPIRRKTKIQKSLRDRIVLDHLPLVKAIAVRVHENLPVHVDLDDLIHAGVLGLFDAAGKYNPEKKVVFHSYAKHRIKGAILDSLRQLDWASRDLRRRHKQVEAVTRDLSAQLERMPTEAELLTVRTRLPSSAKNCSSTISRVSLSPPSLTITVIQSL